MSPVKQGDVIRHEKEGAHLAQGHCWWAFPPQVPSGPPQYLRGAPKTQFPQLFRDNLLDAQSQAWTLGGVEDMDCGEEVRGYGDGWLEVAEVAGQCSLWIQYVGETWGLRGVLLIHVSHPGPLISFRESIQDALQGHQRIHSYKFQCHVSLLTLLCQFGVLGCFRGSPAYCLGLAPHAYT